MGKAWKQFERFVGSIFWVFRNSLSGSNNRNDDGTKRKGDILFDKYLNVDAKNYKKLAVDNWMQKLEDESDKPPLLVMHKKRRNYANSIVAMPLEDFEKIKEYYLKKVAGMDQEEIDKLKERWKKQNEQE